MLYLQAISTKYIFQIPQNSSNNFTKKCCHPNLNLFGKNFKHLTYTTTCTLWCTSFLMFLHFVFNAIQESVNRKAICTNNLHRGKIFCEDMLPFLEIKKKEDDKRLCTLKIQSSYSQKVTKHKIKTYIQQFQICFFIYLYSSL